MNWKATQPGNFQLGARLRAPENQKKCETRLLASKLLPTTAGSARLDLASRESITLMTSLVHLASTGVWGPLGNNTHSLLIGCSSATRLGLFVLPRVVDQIMRAKYRLYYGPSCHPALYLRSTYSTTYSLLQQSP